MKKSTLKTALESIDRILENIEGNSDFIFHRCSSSPISELKELLSHAGYSDDYEKEQLEEIIQLREARTEIKGALNNV